MSRFIQILMTFCIVVLLGCAAIDPNPNVGLRSVNLMLKSGNCEGATEILRAAADRGEPWAQLRLGYFSITKQCPGVEVRQGIEMLTRAACYQSVSPWERGSELSVGNSGYFNARYSSVEAAMTLVQMNQASGSKARIHYWLGVAAEPYESGSPERVEYEHRKEVVYKSMSEQERDESRSLAICEKVRTPHASK